MMNHHLELITPIVKLNLGIQFLCQAYVIMAMIT